MKTWHEVKEAVKRLALIEPNEETGAAPPTDSALGHALKLAERMDHGNFGLPCRVESTAWRTVVLTWGKDGWRRIEVYDDGHFDIFRPNATEEAKYSVHKVTDKAAWQWA